MKKIIGITAVLGLVFAAERTNNATIAGVTFDVIPEPATLGLVAMFGGGIVFIRRRFML